MFKTLGLGHLLEDPRFKGLEERLANGEELANTFAAMFRTKTSLEWEQILNDAHVPCAQVRAINEILETPQVKARGQLHTFKKLQSTDSDVTVLNAPFKFAKDGPQVKLPPPMVGEHTEAILGADGDSLVTVSGKGGLSHASHTVDDDGRGREVG